MKRILMVVAMMALAMSASALEKAQGYCEQGGMNAHLAGMYTTDYVQQSYPKCTVTVYLAGTTTPATIYSDNASTPTPKSYTFTASSQGYWFFYAPNGRYDVRLSGTGITTPYTWGDYLICDPASATGTLNCTGGGGGGGGTPAPPQYAVQFNNPLGTFAGNSNFEYNPAPGSGQPDVTLATSDPSGQDRPMQVTSTGNASTYTSNDADGHNAITGVFENGEYETDTVGSGAYVFYEDAIAILEEDSINVTGDTLYGKFLRVVNDSTGGVAASQTGMTIASGDNSVGGPAGDHIGLDLEVSQNAPAGAGVYGQVTVMQSTKPITGDFHAAEFSAQQGSTVGGTAADVFLWDSSQSDAYPSAYNLYSSGHGLVYIGGATTIANNLTVTGTCTGCGGGLADPGSNGVIKRTALNVTAPAVAADVYGLFSGTTGPTYCLGSDGATHLCSGGSGMVWPGTAGIPYWTSGTAWGGAYNASTQIPSTYIPTLNQNTTGSAAKWTTARNLAGNSVDGSANVQFANAFIVQGTADGGLSGAQFLGALGTGIVKNTTTTGALSIAIAGDFPTLNQSTTGNAATATALASSPLQCSAGSAATGVAASGNANCSTAATIFGYTPLNPANNLSDVLSISTALANLGAVPTSRTVNGHALTSNVVVSASDLTTGTLPHAQLPTLLSGDIPNNAANTTGTAANLTAAAALPNGTTCTTQTTGDSTTKCATDAFVAAAVAAGGSGNFSGPGSAVSGNIVTFNGTSGHLGQDSGYALPASAIVGLTDTQSLTNKNMTSATNSWPTFNQSTTGNAATATTAGNVSGVVAIVNGGTGSTTAAAARTALGAAASTASTTVNGQTCQLGLTCTVVDSTKVPTTTTVNGHALSSNVVVSASDLTTGTLPTSAEPGFTGDVTKAAGSVATTVTALRGATLPTLAASTGYLYDSAGTLSLVTGGSVLNIASGTAALGTSAIASGACASAVTVSASGVLTTDILTVSFNGDPTAVTGFLPVVTGMLTIVPYPTANNVNFKVCNTTASSITPGAITLNWKVVR